MVFYTVMVGGVLEVEGSLVDQVFRGQAGLAASVAELRRTVLESLSSKARRSVVSIVRF